MSRNWFWLSGFGVVATVVVAVGVGRGVDSAWTPEQWKDESTLRLCTTNPGEDEHCFPVWLVVLDGDVFVRLGSRAAGRMEKNATGAILPVEVAGHRFEHVRATNAPQQVDRVANAMAAKYTMDRLVRLFHHPLTMRLKPEDVGRTTGR
jgi:hypothetical protein